MHCPQHKTPAECSTFSTTKGRWPWEESFADCPITSLRACIVTCRRHKKPGPPPEWGRMRDLFEQNTDYFCKHLNTRWLVSVADTYADYGTPEQRLAALITVNTITFDKMACAWDFACGCPSAKQLPRQPKMYDGIVCIVQGTRADAHRNLLRRNAKALACCPSMFKLWKACMLGMLKSPIGTVRRLNTIHDRNLIKDYHKWILPPDPKS